MNKKKNDSAITPVENAIVLNKKKINAIQKRDPQFALDLNDGIKSIKTAIINTPSIIEALKNIKSEELTFRAILPRSIINGLKTGKLTELRDKKTGQLLGSIINKSTGKIVKKVRFEPVKRINTQKFNQQLQHLALQASIAELSEKIIEIDEKVQLVLEGQHTDRVALIISGINSWEQALTIEDPTIRSNRIQDALHDLGLGITSINGSLQTTLRRINKTSPLTIFQKLYMLIKSIDTEEYNKWVYVNKNYSTIKESIKYINLAYAYSYRIYSHFNELEAIKTLGDQYTNFLYSLRSKILPLSDYITYKPKMFLPDVIKKQYSLIAKINQNILKFNKDIVVELEAKELFNE